MTEACVSIGLDISYAAVKAARRMPGGGRGTMRAIRKGGQFEETHVSARELALVSAMGPALYCLLRVQKDKVRLVVPELCVSPPKLESVVSQPGARSCAEANVNRRS